MTRTVKCPACSGVGEEWAFSKWDDPFSAIRNLFLMWRCPTCKGRGTIWVRFK